MPCPAPSLAPLRSAAANRGLYRVHQFSKVEMFAVTPGGLQHSNGVWGGGGMVGGLWMAAAGRSPSWMRHMGVEVHATQRGANSIARHRA
jgi:hypothetical protein